MSNILDYIKWRGDLSFEASPFNEVDGLIFAKLAYIVFDEVVAEGFDNPVTLNEFYKRKKNLKDELIKMLLMKVEDFENLLKLCAKSKRFKNCKLYNYVNIVNPSKDMQFSAITFELDTGKIVIAYRGTDDTIAGWKEDFNMGIMKAIPSQIKALKYLNNTCKFFSDRKIYCVGHSKGGNLAIYSSIHATERIINRIDGIYNFDGPGFNGNIDDNERYHNLLDKIHTIIPQSSIIGMLLNRREDTTIIKSNATGGLSQHYGFTWELIGTKFTRIQNLNSGSQIIDNTLKQFLSNATMEEKELLVDSIAKVFAGYETFTLTDITSERIHAINQIAKNLDGVDKNTKTLLNNALRMMFHEGLDIVKASSPIKRLR